MTALALFDGIHGGWVLHTFVVLLWVSLMVSWD